LEAKPGIPGNKEKHRYPGNEDVEEIKSWRK